MFPIQKKRTFSLPIIPKFPKSSIQGAKIHVPKEKKKKGNVNNVPNSKKILPILLTIRPSYSKSGIQEAASLKEKNKKKGTLVTFPNQKKDNPVFPLSQLTQFRFQSEVQGLS
jgi:hypothetical protein